MDAQVAAVMQRLLASLAGQTDAQARCVDLRPEPVRRSQERALAASLGAELLTLLRAAEQRLVAYFEDGAQRDSLDLAAKWLRQMRSVLGLAGGDPRLAQAAAFCAEHVGRWAAGQAVPQPEESARVAAVLSGLSYYLENLEFAAADFASVMRRAGAPEQLWAPHSDAAVEPQPQAAPAPAGEPAGSAASGRTRCPVRCTLPTCRPIRKCFRCFWRRRARCCTLSPASSMRWRSSRPTASGWGWCGAASTR